jgi:hypothetical protein
MSHYHTTPESTKDKAQKNLMIKFICDMEPYYTDCSEIRYIPQCSHRMQQDATGTTRSGESVHATEFLMDAAGRK